MFSFSRTPVSGSSPGFLGTHQDEEIVISPKTTEIVGNRDQGLAVAAFTETSGHTVFRVRTAGERDNARCCIVGVRAGLRSAPSALVAASAQNGQFLFIVGFLYKPANKFCLYCKCFKYLAFQYL